MRPSTEHDRARLAAALNYLIPEGNGFASAIADFVDGLITTSSDGQAVGHLSPIPQSVIGEMLGWRRGESSLDAARRVVRERDEAIARADKAESEVAQRCRQIAAGAEATLGLSRTSPEYRGASKVLEAMTHENAGEFEERAIARLAEVVSAEREAIQELIKTSFDRNRDYGGDRVINRLLALIDARSEVKA